MFFFFVALLKSGTKKKSTAKDKANNETEEDAEDREIDRLCNSAYLTRSIAKTLKTHSDSGDYDSDLKSNDFDLDDDYQKDAALKRARKNQAKISDRPLGSRYGDDDLDYDGAESESVMSFESVDITNQNSNLNSNYLGERECDAEINACLESKEKMLSLILMNKDLLSDESMTSSDEYEDANDTIVPPKKAANKKECKEKQAYETSDEDEDEDQDDDVVKSSHSKFRVPKFDSSSNSGSENGQASNKPRKSNKGRI